jgi:hypothetical protein
MKIVYRIDQNGFFVEEVQINENEEIPSDCVDCDFPQGLYKPRYINGEFVSSLAQEEINAELNAPKPLTEMEQLKKDQTDLVFTLMMGGYI